MVTNRDKSRESGTANNSAQPVLAIDGLCCFRDELALFSPVDLHLYTHELLLIEGDNGVGKTTLLRALLGLRAMQWQSVRYLNHSNEQACSALRAQACWLGHAPAMKSELSLWQNWQFWFALEGQSFSRADADNLATRVRLAGFEDAAFGSLSAGQKKRAQLARLAHSKRKLWLMDEPFANLDRAGIALVETELHHHLKTGGMAIATSHGVFPFEMPHRVLRLSMAEISA